MIHDKELIRRALLGDQGAQKECTEKGIALPCPHCGSDKVNKKYACGDYWYSCEHCKADSGMHGDYRISLSEWNTRPAPPIGRCGKCETKKRAIVNANGFLICPVSGMEIIDNDFCSYFEPKEE